MSQGYVAKRSRCSPASRRTPPGAPRRRGNAATDVVAVLRATVARNTYDKPLSDLVGELSTRSDEFRTRWAAHNVRRHTSGSKRMRHHVIGEIELNYQSFELPGNPELRLSVFTAEPDTPSQQALRFLASWADSDGAIALNVDATSEGVQQPRVRGTDSNAL